MLLIFLKDNIKTLSKELKLSEKKLTEITSKLEKVLTIKQVLEDTQEVLDISKMAAMNAEFKQLKNEETDLQNIVEVIKQQIEGYNQKLYFKGEWNDISR